MAAAIEEEKAPAPAGGVSAEAAGGPEGTPLDMPDFTGQGDEGKLLHGIELLHDVGLRVKIELGRTDMLVENVLKLGEGSVVELDKLAGDPVDVFANDRLIARGEVLVLNDNFCVRISEIVSGTGRMAARG
ncbi:MAG: flagellar motor switch protein FliN [Planctomycetes bacterium]|nr:flagellar motor switch protein FliN [Planctomycetota bacterium]